MVQDIKRQPNEGVNDYKHRVFALKLTHKLNLTWEEIHSLMMSEIGYHKSTSAMKHEARRWADSIENDEQQTQLSFEEQQPSQEDTLRQLILEFRKERVILSDVSAQNNAAVRRLAREDNIKEIAEDYANKMTAKKLLPVLTTPIKQYNGECEGILQLSDWHYGIDVKTFWNTFNLEVCRERIATLRDETILFCKLFHINHLHVVNLGDLICGRIHQALRLQSRIDVVTQAMDVSEILAEFISELTAENIFIDYYDCFDNHSRLEPVKMDSLELESFVRIIPWYLQSRLVKNPRVKINGNTYDGDIIAFDVLGYRIGGVHGHKDKPGKVVDNLTLFTKETFDMILTAHLHHFSGDEKNEVMVVSNGSLMGTDYYAKDLRLSSKPSQNLIAVTRKSVADYIHRVVL